MAKINFGQTVNDARGKLGGTVFSKNGSGAYTRRKVTPVNRNTLAQSTVRASLGTLSQQWSGSLSQAQRDAWISYAKTYPRLDVFGASITISGLNMFISLNSVLMNTGNTVIDVPPANNLITPIPTDYTSMAANHVGPVITFNQTGNAVDGDDVYYVFGAKPLPPGRTVQQSDWRFLTTIVPATTGYPVTTPVSSAYAAKFGAFAVNMSINLLVSTMRTGSGLTTVGVRMQSNAS